MPLASVLGSYYIHRAGGGKAGGVEGVQYSSGRTILEEAIAERIGSKDAMDRVRSSLVREHCWDSHGQGSTVGIAMACLCTYVCPTTLIFTVYRSFTRVLTQTEECEGGIKSSPSPNIPIMHLGPA